MNRDLSARAARIASMLSVFRGAIPEIPQDAELLFIDSGSSWHRILKEFGVELKKYDIPGPGSSRFEFTIAFIPDRNIVIARQIPPEEVPEGSAPGDYFIKQYIPENKP